MTTLLSPLQTMTRRALIAGAACAVLCTPLLGAAEDALTAQQIIDKMSARNSTLGVNQGQAQITLLIKDKSGDKRVRSMQVRSKKIGESAKSVVKLTAPKEVKGQSFLFSENKSADDDVWMFLPAFKVTRRIEGSNKKGAFLGSHFSFSDLESRDIKSGTYKKLPDEKIKTEEVYVIQSTPKSSVKSEYGKVVTYVRKRDYLPSKVKFYAPDGTTLVKTIFMQQFAKTSKGEPYVKQMTLSLPEGGGFTTIKIDSISDSVDLPDAIFTKEQFSK